MNTFKYNIEINDSMINIVNFYMNHTDIGMNLLKIQDIYKSHISNLNSSFEELSSKPDIAPLTYAFEWIRTSLKEYYDRNNRIKNILASKQQVDLTHDDREMIVTDFLSHEGITIIKNEHHVILNSSSIDTITMYDIPKYLAQIVCYYNFTGDSNKLKCYINRLY